MKPADTYKHFLNQKLDNTIEKQIESAAALDGLHVRWWKPGTIGTMDLRNDRLNVSVDSNNLITRIYIG